MNERFFLNNLWRRSVGLPEVSIEKVPSLESLRESERFSPVIYQLMHNRLIMGRFRYGGVKGDVNKQYDRIGSIKKRIEKYEENGNLETLIDIANLVLLEYMHSDHPLRHWSASDEHSLHVYSSIL
jgi:hypothetical protein